jgi:hypothetical protein
VPSKVGLRELSSATHLPPTIHPLYRPDMDRRFQVTSPAPVLAAPLAGEAQPAQTVHRVAIVIATSPTGTMAGPDPPHTAVRPFVRALPDLGYVERQSLVLERRSLEGRWERASEAVR